MRRLGEVVPSSGNLCDHCRIRCPEAVATRAHSQKCVRSDSFKDLVAVIEGKFWEAEIDPFRPGGWEFSQEREEKSVED